jgi:oligo-1,6-glucosidase
VQWTGGPQAGFTTGTPWLPVNPNHVEINAEAERANPDSVFHHYRRVIALRHSLPVIADGDFTMLLEDEPRVYAYVRALDGVELLVLGNFSGDGVVIDLPGWEDADALIGSPGLALGPWEGKALSRAGSGT